ncbi:MAG: sigma-70 family RNA polymerase sigma factor [Bacteroidales bacterium]|nr:sigma-70 family RNA polymerase sigma factor [Bacteroidales bacterium]
MNHQSEYPPESASDDPIRRFEELYQRHSREVWATAYARCLDSELAMDIVQECFFRLWRQQEAGEEIQNIRAWLLRVARNLAEDYAKSAFRRNGTQSGMVMNAIRTGGIGPHEKLERDELFAQIRVVLDELAPADRELLTLRYALDYDSPQIAEALGIQVAAVHMRLSRARQRLAERLSQHGIEGAS